MEDVRHGPVPLRARRISLRRTAGAGAVCLVLAVVALQLPDALRRVDRRAQELAAMPADQRELLGARAADVDTRVFVEARNRIAVDETYAVVVGPNIEVSLASTRDAVAPFARYYLLPRRQVPEPENADWVISFGGDLKPLETRLRDRLPIAPGIELARVTR